MPLHIKVNFVVTDGAQFDYPYSLIHKILQLYHVGYVCDHIFKCFDLINVFNLIIRGLLLQQVFLIRYFHLSTCP